MSELILAILCMAGGYFFMDYFYEKRKDPIFIAFFKTLIIGLVLGALYASLVSSGG